MISGSSALLQAEQFGVSHEVTPDRGEHYGGGEMAVYPFAHYTLKTHGSGHEGEADEGDGVGPSRARTVGSYTSLTRMPNRDRSSHGEQRLDHRPFFILFPWTNGFVLFEFGSEIGVGMDRSSVLRNGWWGERVGTVAEGKGILFLPVKSHIRVFEPILSPNLPMKAPPRKPSKEHNAC